MKLFATLYEHQEGADIQVFLTRVKADEYRQEVAEENWDHEMTGASKPINPEDMANDFFHEMGEIRNQEWFSIHEVELEATGDSDLAHAIRNAGDEA